METVPINQQQQTLAGAPSTDNSLHQPADNSGSPYGSQSSVRIEENSPYCCSSLCQMMSSMGEHFNGGYRAIRQSLVNCCEGICCTKRANVPPCSSREPSDTSPV